MQVLVVTAMDGAENCVAALTKLLELPCELAKGRKAAVAALRRLEYRAVVVDESIVDSDPAGADALWEHAGLAVPVQVNFALAGTQRLAREIRMALSRREHDRAKAHAAAAAAIENELKSTVAGLLLHSQLALSEREVSAPLAEKLRVVASLAGDLRQQLAPTASASRG